MLLWGSIGAYMVGISQEVEEKTIGEPQVL